MGASKLLCERCEDEVDEKGWKLVDWDRTDDGIRFREVWRSRSSEKVVHLYGCKHEGYYDDWKKPNTNNR